MNTCNDVNAVQVLNEYGKTDGHDLIRQGTFPRGSIQQEGAPGEAPWRCTGGELVGFDYMEGSNAGGRYIYVRLKKNQRLWQDIQLPAKAESRTDYQLGVEYNAGNFNECTVSVYRLEDGEVQGQAFFTYPLKGAGVQPDENADPAWMTLALIPIKVPTDATDIRVVFETPNPDITAFLFLKQTRSLLSLPPLGEHTKLQLTVDPDNEQLIHPEGALALCHGAKHLLEVKAPDGDAWLNLPISLLWLQDDDLPGEYRLTSTPPLNTNNGSQEEFYQDLLPSETAVWLLDAQGGSDTPSGEVTLGLGSFHHADKFALPAELGDFRFEVKKPQWDGETPIVELGNSTDLTAAVVSAFDDTRVLESKKVEWWLNGSHYKDEVTDASGKTTLHYTPKQGEGGTGNSVTFTVKCVDAYEKPSEQSLAVKVYDTTPWLVDLEVLLDDTPIDDLKELSLRLTRSNNRKLTLKPKPGSYFLDKNISLGWRETGQQLGITFTPDVPQKMLPEGISWSIKGGDESGLFTLEAKAFGLPVALALQGVQMSANLADEATLKYTSIGDEPKIPIFLRQTPGTVSIVPNADSPLGVLGLEGTLSFLKTGALTAQQLPATPAYGTGAAITDNGHTWSLEGKGVSGTFGLEVSVPGFTSLKLDKAALMSNVVSEEVNVTVDGFSAGVPMVMIQGKSYALRAKPKQVSPLGDTQVLAWLNHDGGTVPKDELTAAPAYLAKRNITADGLTWKLTAGNVSGTFKLQAHIDSFNDMLKLENNLIT